MRIFSEEGGFGGYVASEDRRRWFVVATKPCAEKAAEDHVKSLGIETFYPKLVTTRVRRGVKLEVREPLFRSYLFARFDPLREDWLRIGRPHHVARIIAAGPPFFTPKALPVGFVEALIERGEELRPATKSTDFAIGQHVSITDGPFLSFVGTITQLDKSGRVHVLLSLFGRDTDVSLERGQIAPHKRGKAAKAG